MRIVHISDTHNMHERVTLLTHPNGRRFIRKKPFSNTYEITCVDTR